MIVWTLLLRFWAIGRQFTTCFDVVCDCLCDFTTALDDKETIYYVVGRCVDCLDAFTTVLDDKETFYYVFGRCF